MLWASGLNSVTGHLNRSFAIHTVVPPSYTLIANHPCTSAQRAHEDYSSVIKGVTNMFSPFHISTVHVLKHNRGYWCQTKGFSRATICDSLELSLTGNRLTWQHSDLSLRFYGNCFYGCLPSLENRINSLWLRTNVIMFVPVIMIAIMIVMSLCIICIYNIIQYNIIHIIHILCIIYYIHHYYVDNDCSWLHSENVNAALYEHHV